MANTATFTEKLREVYFPQLQEELQDKIQSYAPFVTTIPASGKRLEFNSVRSVEAGFRVGKYDKKVEHELKYGKRTMIPYSVALALKYSKDDMILKGDFAAGPETFVQQMTYAFNRIIDGGIVGGVRTRMKKTSGDTGKIYWTIAGAYDMSSGGYDSDNDQMGYYYSGNGIGGICGTNYTGEHGTVAETLDVQATGTDGTKYATLSSAEAALLPSDTTFANVTSLTHNKIDFDTTGVIPANYVPSGSFSTAKGLTKEKIMAARQLLESKQAIQPGDKICIAITPAMKFEMLQDKDLWNVQNGFQVLKNGFFSELLGVYFLVTPKVPIVNVNKGVKILSASGASTTKNATEAWQFACPVWVPTDIMFGKWDDLQFEIDKPADFWGKYRIAAQCSIGCCRARKESVAFVMCDAGLPTFKEAYSSIESTEVATNS